MKGYVLSVERLIRASPAAIFDVLSDAAKHSLIDGSGMLQGSREPEGDRLCASLEHQVSGDELRHWGIGC